VKAELRLIEIDEAFSNTARKSGPSAQSWDREDDLNHEEHEEDEKRREEERGGNRNDARMGAKDSPAASAHSGDA